MFWGLFLSEIDCEGWSSESLSIWNSLQKVAVASISLFFPLLMRNERCGLSFPIRGRRAEMTASRCSGSGSWRKGGVCVWGGSGAHMAYQDKSHMHGCHVAEPPLTPHRLPTTHSPKTHSRWNINTLEKKHPCFPSIDMLTLNYPSLFVTSATVCAAKEFPRWTRYKYK